MIRSLSLIALGLLASSCADAERSTTPFELERADLEELRADLERDAEVAVQRFLDRAEERGEATRVGSFTAAAYELARAEHLELARRVLRAAARRFPQHAEKLQRLGDMLKQRFEGRQRQREEHQRELQRDLEAYRKGIAAAPAEKPNLVRFFQGGHEAGGTPSSNSP